MLRACVRACTLPCKRQLVITIASSQSNTTNQARKPFLLTIYSPKASEIQFHGSSSISPRHIASSARQQQQQHQQKKERKNLQEAKIATIARNKFLFATKAKRIQ
jgi:hypothetical protein